MHMLKGRGGEIMQPIEVKTLIEIMEGKLLKGQTNLTIRHGAYRMKQIKYPQTLFFAHRKIVDWSYYSRFFPIVVVTSGEYMMRKIPEGVSLIYVDQVETAYWRFVHYYRSLFNIPFIAITGTAGKTTTKEMIKHILMKKHSIVATHLSNNSRTEYLQNLLRVNHGTTAAIFETAVGVPGDVLLAGEHFKPTIGVITNIGKHHLDRCKTVDDYIQAKGEMLEVVQNGTIIVNAEDANTKKLNWSSFQGQRLAFGQKHAHFIMDHIAYTKTGMRFILYANNEEYVVHIKGHGKHQVYNAAAALLVVSQIGVTLPYAIARLATYEKLNKQLQLEEGIRDSLIIDDTWSITTTSLDAALDVLQKLGERKKTIAIIGSLTDVGTFCKEVHKDAGALVVKHQIQTLITVGQHATMIAEEAKRLQMKGQVYAFKNSILAKKLLMQLADEETVILIKGDMYSYTMHDLASFLKRKGGYA